MKKRKDNYCENCNIQYDADVVKRRLKEKSKKNQSQCAEDLGLSTTCLSRKLNNNAGELNVSDLLKIAEKYDCSIDYLLGLSDSDSNIKTQKTEDTPALRYPDFIKSLVAFLDLGCLEVKKDNAGAVTFTAGNEIADFIINGVMRMRELYINGSIDDDTFKTYLNGLFNDFDYKIVSHAFVQSFTKRAGSGANMTLTEITSFDDWKKYNNPIKGLSERDLILGYASELQNCSETPFV